MGSKAIGNNYFDVTILFPGQGTICGKFTHIDGLGIDFEYEHYYEGGSLYPRFMYDRAKVQTLTLRQGILTTWFDFFAQWAETINVGMVVPAANGWIMLKNEKGESQRRWDIWGAYLVKYSGPVLDANETTIAVNEIQLVYGGSF